MKPLMILEKGSGKQVLLTKLINLSEALETKCLLSVCQAANRNRKFQSSSVLGRQTTTLTQRSNQIEQATVNLILDTKNP
jgi:hypothetical protein